MGTCAHPAIFLYRDCCLACAHRLSADAVREWLDFHGRLTMDQLADWLSEAHDVLRRGG